jgi:hypothetical protein
MCPRPGIKAELEPGVRSMTTFRDTESMNSNNFPANGRCTCGAVHYTLNREPMFVHCCHCSWCQRETGSAFALNALIETEHLSVTKGVAERIETPSNSGAGQLIARCPICKVALWSHYGGAKEKVAFVRVGTLDNPGTCPPDIHIFTSSKQSWLTLNDDVPKFAEYYRRSAVWSEQSVKRYKDAIQN